jgi:hypothetical protein
MANNSPFEEKNPNQQQTSHAPFLHLNLTYIEMKMLALIETKLGMRHYTFIQPSS